LWNCLRQFFMMFRSGNGGDSMPSDTTRITPNDDPIDEAPVAMHDSPCQQRSAGGWLSFSLSALWKTGLAAVAIGPILYRKPAREQALSRLFVTTLEHLRRSLGLCWRTGLVGDQYVTGTEIRNKGPACTYTQHESWPSCTPFAAARAFSKPIIRFWQPKSCRLQRILSDA